MKGFGLAALLAGAVLVIIGGGVVAQEGYQVARSGYDLSWWTAGGGGYTFSTSGNYSLGGTVGQPDAGLLTGLGYTLAGGFWSGVGQPYRVYLPLVMRNYR
jgi:hypothetical protein